MDNFWNGINRETIALCVRQERLDDGLISGAELTVAGK